MAHQELDRLVQIASVVLPCESIVWIRHDRSSEMRAIVQECLETVEGRIALNQAMVFRGISTIGLFSGDKLRRIVQCNPKNASVNMILVPLTIALEAMDDFQYAVKDIEGLTCYRTIASAPVAEIRVCAHGKLVAKVRQVGEAYTFTVAKRNEIDGEIMTFDEAIHKMRGYLETHDAPAAKRA